MTENYLLKLLIYQGRDWRLDEGSTVSIRAILGKTVVGTSRSSYTSPCPKFNAQLCWQFDRKDLRKYKLNRVPIKIEFINYNQNCQKLLGYVILPLSLAAEGIEVHTQWYKLLGGKLGSNKESPHVLLALSLTAEEQENDQSSEEEVWQEGTESDDVSDNEVSLTHTNGYGSVHEENADPLDQNGHAVNTNAHNPHNIDIETEENICQNEEYDSYEDDDICDEASMVGEAEGQDGIHEEVDLDQRDDEEEGSCYDESVYSEDSYSQRKQPASNEPSIEEKNNKTDSPPVCILPQEKKKVMTENCRLLDSRSNVRDQLRRLSKEHSLSQTGHSSHTNQEFISPIVHKRSLDSSNFSNTGNKRFLDNSDLLNSVSKIRKIDDTFNGEITLNGIIKNRKTGVDPFTVDDQHNRFTKLTSINVTGDSNILKNDSVSKCQSTPPELSSSVMNILLSTSGGHPQASNLDNEHTEKEIFRAELSEDNGFFRILPSTNCGKENKYLFSVTIIYAEYLEKVISQDLWSKLKHDGLQFKYSLFGCSVFTEPFFTIDGHVILSERGTATVCSERNQLCKYFSQHSFLSVDLISGNMIIANCTVDLDKLQKVKYLDQIEIEDRFDLSVSPAFSKCFKTNQATVGICVELCQENCTNRRDKIYLMKKSAKCSENKYENRNLSRRSLSRIDLDRASSEDTTDSEEELLTRIMSRLQWGRNKTKNKRLMHAMKKEKKDYLQEAAIEIENWKEQQKQVFLKKWSSREETLQRHLATEWNTKVKIFENILEQRLDGCTQLQDTLSEALDKLSVQENKLRQKEVKVNKIEKDVRTELDKIRSNNGEALHKSVIVENKKIELLENEVKKLKERSQLSEKLSKDQMQEIFSLRKKILQMDDIKILKREKERLSEQLVLTEEKKQYYKHQWTSAIADVHSMHLAQKHATDPFLDAEAGPSNVSNLGLKIRHLIEERKALTESGLYSHSHSMVRGIDKKVKSLINSTHNL